MCVAPLGGYPNVLGESVAEVLAGLLQQPVMSATTLQSGTKELSQQAQLS